MSKLEKALLTYGFTMLSKRTKWSESIVNGDISPLVEATRLCWEQKWDDALHILSNGESDEYFYLEGWIYQMGLKNYTRAFELYTRCSRDYYSASYNLGVMYQNGEYCEKDIDKAYSLWLAGAEAGHGNSMVGVASVLINKKEDGWKTKSEEWLDKAMRIGGVDSPGIAAARYIYVASELDMYRNNTEGILEVPSEVCLKFLTILAPVLEIHDGAQKLHENITVYLSTIDRTRFCDIIEKHPNIQCGVVKGEYIISIESLSLDDSDTLNVILNRQPKIGDLLITIIEEIYRKRGMDIIPNKITKCHIRSAWEEDPLVNVPQLLGDVPPKIN